MMILLILGFLLSIGVAGAIAYYFLQSKKERVERETQFRRSLIHEIKKKGAKQFSLPQFAEKWEVSRDSADRIAESLYAQVCTKCLEDGVISEAERRQLDLLGQALAIPVNQARTIEGRLKDEKYLAAALNALGQGALSSEDVAELERLRSALGLSKAHAASVTGSIGVDAYLAQFRKVISDGWITKEELAQLQRYRSALSLSPEQATQIVRADAVGLYRQWFYNVIQDGAVTDEEERSLHWLESEFGLSNDEEVQACKQQLHEIKQLAAIRDGNLPSLKTSKLLESGEICHWQGSCIYQWSTATQVKNSTGELIVTSERVIFSSPTRSFDFSPSKIVDIQLFSDALELQCSGRHGAGQYYVEDSRLLEAVMVGIARRHKYLLSEKFSSNQTRHIPESVRREVWARDRGSCVRCGARQYLEYDHLIPHTKGGANTVNNVQLLCRKCNNFKSDRI